MLCAQDSPSWGQIGLSDVHRGAIYAYFAPSCIHKFNTMYEVLISGVQDGPTWYQNGLSAVHEFDTSYEVSNLCVHDDPFALQFDLLHVFSGIF